MVSAVCAAAIAHINPFFCLYQQNKSFGSKVKFSQDSNNSKRIAKLVYATKTKESITSQKLGSQDFWKIASVFNKGKFAILPLLNESEVLPSASDKAK